MKLWRLITTVETDDDFDEKKIISKIYTDLNRGDGLYMNIEKPKLKLKLIRKVKEED